MIKHLLALVLLMCSSKCDINSKQFSSTAIIPWCFKTFPWFWV